MLALRETVDEDLWRSHADELLRFATVLVGPADAYDLVADTMLRVAAHANAPAVANKRAYLFRAVANRAVDQRRSQQRRWRRDLAAVGPASTSQPDDFADVRRAVSELTPMQRAGRLLHVLGRPPRAGDRRVARAVARHRSSHARAGAPGLAKGVVMNDDLSDRRLGRAVRSSLGDIVAAAPSSVDPPRRGSELSPPSGSRRPIITLAAGLTAAAGILGVLVLANRDDGPPTESEATTPGGATTELAAAASGSTETPSSTTAPSRAQRARRPAHRRPPCPRRPPHSSRPRRPSRAKRPAAQPPCPPPPPTCRRSTVTSTVTSSTTP